MADLLAPLQSIIGDPALTGAVGSQAGQLTALAEQVGKLVDNPPGDFGEFFDQLASMPLPAPSLPDNLGQGLTDLLPGLQDGLGQLLPDLLDHVGDVEKKITGGLENALKPLLEAIERLANLFAGDPSCGLIAGFAAPPPNPPNGNPPAPSPAITPAQVAAAKAQITAIPAAMTVRDLLIWVHGKVNGQRPAALFFRSIPLIDDLLDPLDSLVRWDGLSGAQLVQEFEQSLAAMTTLIENQTRGAITAAFNQATTDALSAEALGVAAQDLTNALTALKAAIVSQDAPAIAAQLSAAQDAQARIVSGNASLDAQAAALEALGAMLAQLPAQLESAMCRLLVLLSPTTTWADLSAPLAQLPMPLDGATFQPLTDLLGRVQETLENLLGLIDVGAVTAPLEQVFGEAKTAIDGVGQQIVQVTAAAKAQFQSAGTALQAIDLGAFQQQAEQAIDAAAGDIQQRITQGLQPAADALGSAISAIVNAVDGFDPEQITQPVEQAMAAIESAFQSADLQQMLTALQQLESLVGSLDAVSFRPVADLVISGIGEVKSALDSIDDSNLSPPMPDLINAAMSVLPRSLDPLTEPLVGDLRDIIAQGPTQILQQIRGVPALITAQLQQFSPRALLADPLGKPYAQLRERVDGFEPTAWLDAADHELDSLRQRLADALDLAPLLKPIADTQQQVLGQLRQFSPAQLMAPLSQRVDAVLAGLVDAVPTDSITGALDQVIGRIRGLLQPLEAAVEVVQDLIERLSKLADPRGQLDAWLTDILGKLPDSAPATLAGALTTLQASVEAAKTTNMSAVYAAARKPLADKLAAASAPALLGQLTQARNQLAGLTGLPGDVAAWVNALQPLDPDFSRGLRLLTRLGDALARADGAMATLFTDWDDRYHRAGSPLAGLVPDLQTPDQWRAHLMQAIDAQLGAPVVLFCRQLFVLSGLLQSFNTAITALLAAVNSQVERALAAPQALAGIGEAMQQIKDQLANLDLALFSREADAQYRQLLAQIQALDPQKILTPLREHLAQTLDAISLAAVFTPALRKTLQDSYAHLTDRIKGVDPLPLLIDPLQAGFDQTIQPLAQGFDIGPTVDALQTWFDGLPAQLQTELDRVDTAYQELLRTAPTGGASQSVGF